MPKIDDIKVGIVVDIEVNAPKITVREAFRSTFPDDLGLPHFTTKMYLSWDENRWCYLDGSCVHDGGPYGIIGRYELQNREHQEAFMKSWGGEIPSDLPEWAFCFDSGDPSDYDFDTRVNLANLPAEDCFDALPYVVRDTLLGLKEGCTLQLGDEEFVLDMSSDDLIFLNKGGVEWKRSWVEHQIQSGAMTVKQEIGS